MAFILKTKNSVFHWSGGKDSALALHKVIRGGSFEIKELWTSLSKPHQRISMHGVRRSLLEKQAERIGIPLKMIFLEENTSMPAYNDLMLKNYQKAKQNGNNHHLFGDIHLEDLKKYREEQLSLAGLTGHYPLWKKESRTLIHEFIELGFKAVIVCVDGRKLDKKFLGRTIDNSFINDLPEDVDPCGENGEFHSFVYDGPIFKERISFLIGEFVFKEYNIATTKEKDCFSKKVEEEPVGFWFCDLKEV